MLNLTLYSLLAGYPGERRRYNSPRRITLAPYGSWHLYSSQSYTKCPRLGTKFNQHRKLELISPAGTLKFMAIDILESLPRTKAGYQFVVIMTNKYTKLERVIPTAKITSTQVANIFINDWRISYGISNTVFSDNGREFFRKFFTSLWFYVGSTKRARTVFSRRQTGSWKI